MSEDSKPQKKPRTGNPTGLISPEDEKRPVVGFLRAAGWTDRSIAMVIEAHKRGEPFKATVRIP